MYVSVDPGKPLRLYYKDRDAIDYDYRKFVILAISDIPLLSFITFELITNPTVSFKRGMVYSLIALVTIIYTLSILFYLTNIKTEQLNRELRDEITNHFYSPEWQTKLASNVEDKEGTMRKITGSTAEEVKATCHELYREHQNRLFLKNQEQEEQIKNRQLEEKQAHDAWVKKLAHSSDYIENSF